ncbi:MAG TPA: aminodeoxychorismate synthase component I [Methylophilaceae bacterium]|nr:aminodeoxychorismate synthase component I [Methylophilaceae bacterium]
MREYELPYEEDGARLFARVANRPWAIYLDSGQPESQYGHYDIIVCDPFMTLSTVAGVTIIEDRAGRRQSTADPFTLLKEALAEYPAEACALPFCGGALGYFAYDLGRRLERLPALAEDAEHMPEMRVGLYDWAVIVDHKAKVARLVSHVRHPTTEAAWDALCALFSAPPPEQAEAFAVTSRVGSNMDEAQYRQAFDRIQRYIAEGDCYQVNLAQRFVAKAQGDAWTAYRQLRRISPAPFMAYMNFGDLQVLSASPERFLQVVGEHVETRPIKGTRPRASDSAADAAHAQALQSSLKDRAENLMIVDLLRNDISKSCRVGTVRADRLFALESFANVHHLVSTVTGTLKPGMTAVDLLRGCFPGGSITGAPKLRAMEIIEELEPNRRGLYCGAIGYIGFDGNMDTNIAIRTAVYSNGEFRFWAGGGIVADSEMDKEYRETWDKASSMLVLMQYFGGEVTHDLGR